MRTIRISIKHMSHVPIKTSMIDQLNITEKLASFIMGRDTSGQNAVKLREFKSHTHTSNYFWSLYQLNEAQQRNSQMGLWDVMLGLLTQFELPNGVSTTGMRDHFLRMIWERSGKYIETINTSDCMQMDDLVKKLHTHVGGKLVYQLKFWSFVLDTVELASDSLTVFTNKMPLLHNKYNIGHEQTILKTITQLSLVVAPDAKDYLTDKGIAETILKASQSYHKNEMLNVEALVSPTPSTECLDKILTTNLNKAKKIKEAVERLEAFKNGDAEQIFNLFLPPYVSHVHNKGNSEKFRGAFYNYIKADNVDVVIHLFDKSDERNLIGKKRLLAMIKRFASTTSRVYAYFNESYTLPKIQPIDMRNYDRILKNVVNGLLVDIYQTAEAENLILESERVETSSNLHENLNEFIPIDKAIITAQEVNTHYETLMNLEDIECSICMNEYNDTTYKKQILHGDSRHKVCMSCFNQLDECPFCRQSID